MTIERPRAVEAGASRGGRASDWISSSCMSRMHPNRGPVAGEASANLWRDLVGGAPEQKTLHFVSAREMTNILLQLRGGGEPGDYRD